MDPQLRAARNRRKILLVAAATIPVFAFADALALGRFATEAFAVRLVWMAITAVLALALPKVSPRAERILCSIVAAVTSVFFVVLVVMTGGPQSPLFHWILAVPLLIAVVIQDFPEATVLSAALMLGGGIAVELRGGVEGAVIVQWLVQAAAMSLLAYYASYTYGRLRRHERALSEVESELRARDEFLSIASHELKTPLTSLKLYVDHLVRSERSGKAVDQSKQLDVLRHHVDRIAVLVHNLLDVSRINQERLEHRPEPVDVSALVTRVCQRFEQAFVRAGCTLQLATAGEHRGEYSAMWLEQITANLLSNAIKFGAGKPVHVGVSELEGTIQVTVRDEGIGISETDQALLFQRFSRSDEARSYSGFGLGLWISRRLAEAMRGTLEVSSRIGEGSTFTLTLPRQRAQAA